jgi:peptidoglycan/LPS O-acetylase OafA/YrhL
MAEHASQRFAAIDILRLAAASYVLLFHVAAVAEVPKHRLPPFHLFGVTFSGIPSPFTVGATGVSLFFVVSGYCMYRSWARRPHGIGSYFRDRIARIYPIYLIAVLGSAVAFKMLGIEVTPTDILIKIFFLQGFFQQYHLSINGALWSMATEVQFYVMLPWLARWAVRAGLDRFVICCFAFALLFRAGVQWTWAGEPPISGIVRSTFLMNLLPGRIAEFAIGMWIAAAPFPRALRAARWLILPAAALAFSTKFAGPALAAEPLLGVFYGCILVFALHHSASFGRTNSPLAVLGRASYALFLIHLPVASLLVTTLPHALSMYSRLGILLTATVACSIPLSLALYSWIELPLFRLFRVKRDPAGDSRDTTGDGGAP